MSRRALPDPDDELEKRRRQKRQEPSDANLHQPNTPNTKPETSRSERGHGGSGSGGNTRPTAIGYGDDGQRFKPGQNLLCRIIRAEPGGYEVRVTKGNLPGFLPTNAKFKQFEEVLAQFVCYEGSRILLSGRYGGGYPENSMQFVKPVAQEASHHESVTPPRRAIDLLPIPADAIWTTLAPPVTLTEVVTFVEGYERTGFLRVTCDETKVRAAAVLRRGRVVGCIFGDKRMAEPTPTEQSLISMLGLPLSEMTIEFCYAEEALIDAFASLFLGYPAERHDNLLPQAYIDYIGSWLRKKQQTACLAIDEPQLGTLLAFVHKGQYIGTYEVNRAEFHRDIEFLTQHCEDPSTKVSASILPPEMVSKGFGYKMSLVAGM